MSVTVIPRESYAFLVWRKGGRPPRFRHETLDQAMTEAERLATSHPRAKFLVLQEISRVTYSDPAATIPPAQLEEPGGGTPPPSGSTETTKAIHLRCRHDNCGMEWPAVELPMEALAACEALTRASCPRCGDTKPNFAPMPREQGGSDAG